MFSSKFKRLKASFAKSRKFQIVIFLYCLQLIFFFKYFFIFFYNLVYIVYLSFKFYFFLCYNRLHLFFISFRIKLKTRLSPFLLSPPRLGLGISLQFWAIGGSIILGLFFFPFLSFLFFGFLKSAFYFFVTNFYVGHPERFPYGFFFESCKSVPFLFFNGTESCLSTFYVFYHYPLFNYQIPLLFFDLGYLYSYFYVSNVDVVVISRGFSYYNVLVWVTHQLSSLFFGFEDKLSLPSKIEKTWFFYQYYTKCFFTNLNSLLIGGEYNNTKDGFVFTSDYLIDYSYYSRGLFREIFSNNYWHFFDFQSFLYCDFSFYNYKKNCYEYTFGIFQLFSKQPFFFFNTLFIFLWFYCICICIVLAVKFCYGFRIFLVSCQLFIVKKIIFFLKYFELNSMHIFNLGFWDSDLYVGAPFYYARFNFLLFLVWQFFQNILQKIGLIFLTNVSFFFKSVFNNTTYINCYYYGRYPTLFFFYFTYFKLVIFLFIIKNLSFFCSNFNNIITYLKLKQYLFIFWYSFFLNFLLKLNLQIINCLFFILYFFKIIFFFFNYLSIHCSFFTKTINYLLGFFFYFKTIYYVSLRVLKISFFLHLLVDPSLSRNVLYSFFQKKESSFSKYLKFRDHLFFFFDQITLKQNYLYQISNQILKVTALPFYNLNALFFQKFRFIWIFFRTVSFYFIHFILLISVSSLAHGGYQTDQLNSKKVDSSLTSIDKLCNNNLYLLTNIDSFERIFSSLNIKPTIFLNLGHFKNSCTSNFSSFSELFGSYYHSFGGLLFLNFGLITQIYSFIFSQIYFGPWNSIYFGFHRPSLFDFSALFPVNALVDQFFYIILRYSETYLEDTLAEYYTRRGIEFFPSISKLFGQKILSFFEKDGWIYRFILTFDYYIWYSLRISVVDYFERPYYKYRFQSGDLSDFTEESPITFYDFFFNSELTPEKSPDYSGASYPRLVDYFFRSFTEDKRPLYNLLAAVKPFKYSRLYTMSEGTLFYDNEKMVPNVYFSNGYFGFPQLNTNKSAYIQPSRFKQLDLLYDFQRSSSNLSLLRNNKTYSTIDVNLNYYLKTREVAEDYTTEELGPVAGEFLKLLVNIAPWDLITEYYNRVYNPLEMREAYFERSGAFFKNTVVKLNESFHSKNDFWWNPSLFFSSRNFGLSDQNNYEHFPTLFLMPSMSYYPLPTILGSGMYDPDISLSCHTIGLPYNKPITQSIMGLIDPTKAMIFSNFGLLQDLDQGPYVFYNHAMSPYRMALTSLGPLAEDGLYDTEFNFYFIKKLLGSPRQLFSSFGDPRQVSMIRPKAVVNNDVLRTNYYQSVPMSKFNKSEIYSELYQPNLHYLSNGDSNERDSVTVPQYISTYNQEFNLKSRLDGLDSSFTAEEFQITNNFYNSWTKNYFENFCILMNNLIVTNWVFFFFWCIIYSILFFFFIFFIYIILKLVYEIFSKSNFSVFSLLFFFELYRSYLIDSKTFNKVLYQLLNSEYKNFSSSFSVFLQKYESFLLFFNLKKCDLDKLFSLQKKNKLFTIKKLYNSGLLKANVFILKEIYAFGQKDVTLTQTIVHLLKNDLLNNNNVNNNSLDVSDLKKFILFNTFFSKKTELNKLFKLESKYGFTDISLNKYFTSKDWTSIASNYFSSLDFVYFNYFYHFKEKEEAMGFSQQTFFNLFQHFSNLNLSLTKKEGLHNTFPSYSLEATQNNLKSLITNKVNSYTFYFSHNYFSYISYCLFDINEESGEDLFLDSIFDINDENFRESDEVIYNFFNLGAREQGFTDIDPSKLFYKQFYNFIIEDSKKITELFDFELCEPEDESSFEDLLHDSVPGFLEQNHSIFVESYLGNTDDWYLGTVHFSGDKVNSRYETNLSEMMELILTKEIFSGDTSPQFASLDEKKKRIVFETFGTLDPFLDNTFFETNDYVQKDNLFIQSFLLNTPSINNFLYNPLFTHYGEYYYLNSLGDSVEDLDLHTDINPRESYESDLRFPKKMTDFSFFQGYNPNLLEYNTLFNTIDGFGDCESVNKIALEKFLTELEQQGKLKSSFFSVLKLIFSFLMPSSLKSYNHVGTTFNFNSNFEHVIVRDINKLPADLWFLTYEKFKKKYAKRGFLFSKSEFNQVYYLIQLQEFLQFDLSLLLQDNNQLVQDLINARRTIINQNYKYITKRKFDRLPVNVASQELQWLLSQMLLHTSYTTEKLKDFSVNINWFNSLFLSNIFLNRTLQNFLFSEALPINNLNKFPDVFQSYSKHLFETNDIDFKNGYLSFTESGYSLIFEYNHFLNHDITYETVKKPLLMKDYSIELFFTQLLPLKALSGSGLSRNNTAKKKFLTGEFRYHLDEITDKVIHNSTLTSVSETCYLVMQAFEFPLKFIVYPYLTLYLKGIDKDKSKVIDSYKRFIISNINWNLFLSFDLTRNYCIDDEVAHLFKHIFDYTKSKFIIEDFPSDLIFENSKKLTDLTEEYSSIDMFKVQSESVMEHEELFNERIWIPLRVASLKDDGYNTNNLVFGYRTDNVIDPHISTVHDSFNETLHNYSKALKDKNLFWRKGINTLENKQKYLNINSLFNEKLELFQESSINANYFLKEYKQQFLTTDCFFPRSVSTYLVLDDFYWLTTPKYFSKKNYFDPKTSKKESVNLETSFLINEAYLFNFSTHLTEFENKNFDEAFLQIDTPAFSGLSTSQDEVEGNLPILQKAYALPYDSYISSKIQDFEFTTRISTDFSKMVFLNDFNMKTLLHPRNTLEYLHPIYFFIFRFFNFLYYYLGSFYSLKYTFNSEKNVFFVKIYEFLQKKHFNLTSFANITLNIFQPIKYILPILFIYRFISARLKLFYSSQKEYFNIILREKLFFGSKYKLLMSLERLQSDWTFTSSGLKRFFRYFFTQTLFFNHFGDTLSFLDPLKMRYLSYKNSNFAQYLKNQYIIKSQRFFLNVNENSEGLFYFSQLTFKQKSLLLFCLLRYNLEKKKNHYNILFSNFLISYPLLTSFFFIFYHVPYGISVLTHQFFSEFTAIYVKSYISFSIPSWLNLCLTGKNRFFDNLGINDMNYFQPISLVFEKSVEVRYIDIIFNRFSYRFNAIFYHFDQLLLKKYFSFGLYHISFERMNFSVINLFKYFYSYLFFIGESSNLLPFFIQYLNPQVRLSSVSLNNFWLYIHRGLFRYSWDFDVQVTSLFYDKTITLPQDDTLKTSLLDTYYYKRLFDTIADLFYVDEYSSSGYIYGIRRPYPIYDVQLKSLSVADKGPMEYGLRHIFNDDVLYMDSMLKTTSIWGGSDASAFINNNSKSSFAPLLSEKPAISNRFIDYFYTLRTKKKKRSLAYFNSTANLIAHVHRDGFLYRDVYAEDNYRPQFPQIFYGRRYMHYLKYTTQRTVQRGYLLQDFKVRWLQKTLFYGLYNSNHYEQRRILKSAFIQRHYYLLFFKFSSKK